MKHERSLTALTAVLLSLIIAAGAMGCLVSAFDLAVDNPEKLLALWGGLSILSSALLSFQKSSIPLVCLLALAGGYIYHDGRAAQQAQNLLVTLCTVYDRAYGWGVPLLPELPAEAAFADWPLGILGALIIVAVCESVCRRRPATLSVLLTLLPLGACIVVTDTVPGEMWLLTVMAGLILLILTSPVRRENPGQGVRLTFGAALPVALALAALFHSVPQEGYVNQSELLRENILIAVQKLPQVVEGGVTELTTSLQPQPPKQVNLSTLGERIPFTYPVMEVTAEKSGILYLREQDYDAYDGLDWAATADREEPFPHTLLAEEFITIHTFRRKDLQCLPYYPAEDTVLTGGGADHPEDASEYTILRTGLPEDWRQTAYQPASDGAGEWQDYLTLPETTRQGAESILTGLFSDSASNTEKADIIAALVTNSAVYDLDPSRMPQSEPDFALWFLREGERGYCVHFATAATVLLRAADIPARYVTGYMLEAKEGRAVTVTEENAHTWAEYYEPNLGLWLPLEVTPAEEPSEDTLLSPVIPETTEPTEETQIETTEAVVEATLPSESTPAEMPTETAALPEVNEPEPEFPVMPLLLILLLPLLLAAQRSARLALRRHWQRTGDVNKQALRRWQEAERLARILKECPPPELQELALKAKFSQYELTDEELAQFDSFSRTCLRRLKERPWYLRLIYQYIYAAY